MSTYLVIVLGAVILNLFFKKIFIRFNIKDSINERSSHNIDATRTGGSVLFFIVFLYSIFLYTQGNQPFDFSILIPISILYSTGLYDDIYGVDFGLKFIFQIIVAKILIDLGYVIDIFSFFGNEYEFTRVPSQIISIFIYVLLLNAYNFIDGLDLNIHLETIKNLFIIMLVFNFGFEINKLIIFIILIMIINSLFNISSKVKVFMGDSGSLIIPVFLSIFIFEGIKYNFDQNIIKYFLIIFIYPLIDLIRVVVLRILKKSSPFKADKNHIHHILNNKFKSHMISSLVIFVFVLSLQLVLITIFL